MIFRSFDNSLGQPQEFEAEGPATTPKFSRKHLTNQFKLVKILKSYGLRVYVARNDKAKIVENRRSLRRNTGVF